MLKVKRTAFFVLLVFVIASAMVVFAACNKIDTNTYTVGQEEEILKHRDTALIDKEFDDTYLFYGHSITGEQILDSLLFLFEENRQEFERYNASIRASKRYYDVYSGYVTVEEKTDLTEPGMESYTITRAKLVIVPLAAPDKAMTFVDSRENQKNLNRAASYVVTTTVMQSIVWGHSSEEKVQELAEHYMTKSQPMVLTFAYSESERQWQEVFSLPYGEDANVITLAKFDECYENRYTLEGYVPKQVLAEYYS